MIVEFIDSEAGTPVYVNPAYVVTLRPDPANPTGVSLAKLKDGESLRLRGDLREVADRLNPAA
jgi:hypothetical protein